MALSQTFGKNVRQVRSWSTLVWRRHHWRKMHRSHPGGGSIVPSCQNWSTEINLPDIGHHWTRFLDKYWYWPCSAGNEKISAMCQQVFARSTDRSDVVPQPEQRCAKMRKVDICQPHYWWSLVLGAGVFFGDGRCRSIWNPRNQSRWRLDKVN